MNNMWKMIQHLIEYECKNCVHFAGEGCPELDCFLDSKKASNHIHVTYDLVPANCNELLQEENHRYTCFMFIQKESNNGESKNTR